MNNLQPLKWQKGAALDTFETVHELVHYTIRPDIDDPNKYRANLGNGDHKTLNSVEEAKQWIETDYYPHKMQPYVVPLPTWIKATEQQPTHQQEVIVYRYNEDEGAKIEYSLYFNADYFDDDAMIGFSDVKNGGDFLTDVYYWQPIETKALYEAMLMQLQINEVTDD